MPLVISLARTLLPASSRETNSIVWDIFEKSREEKNFLRAISTGICPLGPRYLVLDVIQLTVIIIIYLPTNKLCQANFQTIRYLIIYDTQISYS